jgi:hypothetical protein
MHRSGTTGGYVVRTVTSYYYAGTNRLNLNRIIRINNYYYYYYANYKSCISETFTKVPPSNVVTGVATFRPFPLHDAHDSTNGSTFLQPSSPTSCGIVTGNSYYGFYILPQDLPS